MFRGRRVRLIGTSNDFRSHRSPPRSTTWPGARTHVFAESVIRPVASDYDQRQEFPWPVLDEAAARGFYSPLFYRDLIGDPTGLSLPVFVEELSWVAPESGWRW